MMLPAQTSLLHRVLASAGEDEKRKALHALSRELGGGVVRSTSRRNPRRATKPKAVKRPAKPKAVKPAPPPKSSMERWTDAIAAELPNVPQSHHQGRADSMISAARANVDRKHPELRQAVIDDSRRRRIEPGAVTASNHALKAEAERLLDR